MFNTIKVPNPDANRFSTASVEAKSASGTGGASQNLAV
jgi:hypothetical protein